MDAWVKVSRAALRHNIHSIQAFLGSKSAPRLIAVVKANAYGHGTAETARVFQDCGVDFFATTTLAEAIELREAGILGSVLVFLPPRPEQIPMMVDHDLTLTVCDSAAAAAIGLEAVARGKTASVHLKVDTGMGRLGVLPGDALATAQEIVRVPGIHLGGVYTHFARALEQNWTPTQRQLDQFIQVTEQLKSAGIDPGLRHCANSAAMLRNSATWLDAVRPGTILYGQYPSAAIPRGIDLRDTWQLQARIMEVRTVPTGTVVGYGGEFTTRLPTRLAVLPIGYADGFTVAPASTTAGWRGIARAFRDLTGQTPSAYVSLRGHKAPVVGRVSMQICSIDVTDIPGAQTGDIVTIPARRITASARLPRLYED